MAKEKIEYSELEKYEFCREEKKKTEAEFKGRRGLPGREELDFDEPDYRKMPTGYFLLKKSELEDRE